MAHPRPAAHRTVLVVDVEGFGDERRTNPHRVAIRDGLYKALQQAFHVAKIAWSDCDHEGTGDGVFVLAPAVVPKSLFVESLPHALVTALRAHNQTHCAEERIRLRLALHAGEIKYDDHGVTAAAINLTFRLLDAPPLKAELARSPGVLAIIASPWFYDEVIRHSPASNPAAYRPIRVDVKETRTTGWIYLPDHLTRDSTRAPEPVAVWRLDESRDAEIGRDTVGGYHGTATAVRWGEGSGGAALFDGRSSRVSTAGPVLKTGPGHSYTVSAWAWLDTSDTAPEFATVVSQSAGDLTAFFLQYWARPNRWAFSGPKDAFRVQSSVEAVPRRWTHLVGVCRRGMLTLYVDGKQVGADDSVNVAVPESAADQLIIGGAGLAREYGDTYKDFFPGSIRNVQVFDQALTPDEITALS